MISEKDIENIRTSWDFIMADGLNNMLQFYAHLFEIAPETRVYFRDDMTKLSEKLSYTINILVSNIDRFDSLKPTLEELGRTHNNLNIQPSDYIQVKLALLHTVKAVMGPVFHEDIGKSWDKVLTAVSSIMINAPKKKEENKIGGLLKKLFG